MSNEVKTCFARLIVLTLKKLGCSYLAHPRLLLLF